MRRPSLDGSIVIVAAAVVIALCCWFRYLPMTDLPQHYAMVSIIANLGDPHYGFGPRYLVDFPGHPYAVPYLLGAGLTRLVSLDVAMRVVVALCTLAPAAGLYVLLRAIDRPALCCLAATPLLFGHLWHWGFLNFLLGAGLMQAALGACIIHCQRATVRTGVVLLLLSLLLVLSHFHTWAVLLLGAVIVGVVQWRTARARLVALAWPLLPSALMAAAFMVRTWRGAEGFGRLILPGPGERVRNFVTFAGAGLPDGWPAWSLIAFAATGALMWYVGRRSPPEVPVRGAPGATAAGLVLLQAMLYLALPLQTATANYVYPRQALLLLLAAVPLLAPSSARSLTLLRPALCGLAGLCLWSVAGHLQRFDAEARPFDSIIAGTPWNQRLGAAIVEPRSGVCSNEVFPYLHFGAYLVARRGGDMTMSFASHWNIPVRYRADYPRLPSPHNIEWSPGSMLDPRLARRFDHVLLREGTTPVGSGPPGFRTLIASGGFRLLAPEPPPAAPGGS